MTTQHTPEPWILKKDRPEYDPNDAAIFGGNLGIDVVWERFTPYIN